MKYQEIKKQIKIIKEMINVRYPDNTLVINLDWGDGNIQEIARVNYSDD